MIDLPHDTAPPKPTLLSEYRPPDFVIDEVFLSFSLGEDETIVTSILVLRRNPAAGTPEAPPTAKMPFFQGEPQSMRFVSSYSLQESARGLPRILEFQVIPGKDGEGVRLVVNENLYTGPASAGFFCLGKGPESFLFRPIEIGARSFVLADRLAFCRFTYQEAPPPPAPVKWTPSWVLPRWPGAIRIEMAPLDEGGPRLQPVSITARIHVTRYPIFEYGDY